MVAKAAVRRFLATVNRERGTTIILTTHDLQDIEQIQALMLTVVPLGFASFVPVAYVLGKPIPMLGDLAGLVSPLVGPLLALLAAMHWRFAISKYQGAGG